jgi:hypothetical protein
MAKETSEVMVRALPFSGKQADWDIWSNKFVLIAQAKGYVKALFDGDAALPLRSDVDLDETVPAEKLALKALERYYNAMSALTMAISDFPVGKSYLERANKNRLVEAGGEVHSYQRSDGVQIPDRTRGVQAKQG